ncbi:hypothetical protein LWF01_08730 [Saxibacter everestensis]|uniref:Secreted protein n=1 Tax=Saxibacter everestensis TaxID=2909229 RepID=A0ABY8QXX4_9MICO|nr:hypothetical protein LWF01_08730 [Brevibacteriaceae bacterium ZFBP1038]
MKRIFWLGVGVAVGVVAVRQLSRKTKFLTGSAIAGEASTLADAIRDFGESIRRGMNEREAELRVALGADEGEIAPDRAKSLLESPASHLS